MACRDGFVSFQLTIPDELRWLVERYQNDMKVVSRNATIRMLLETHPALAFTLAGLYDNGRVTTGGPHGERAASL